MNKDCISVIVSTLSLEVRNRESSRKASDTSPLNLLNSANSCSTYFSESWKNQRVNNMTRSRRALLLKLHTELQVRASIHTPTYSGDDLS